MTTKVEAVYEHGVLRPSHPLPLEDGTQVDVLVLSEDTSKPDSNNRASPNKRTPAEIMAEIAALPIEGKTDEFSGADHDKLLYGAR
jgi:predicted DNA-binding antitoxin AbrB/MazE fold protein